MSEPYSFFALDSQFPRRNLIPKRPYQSRVFFYHLLHNNMNHLAHSYECIVHVPLRLRPFSAKEKMTDDVDSEDMEVISKEDIKKKQLSNGINSVQYFHSQVAKCQIIAIEPTAKEYAVSG
jgi:hypothetical protein